MDCFGDKCTLHKAVMEPPSLPNIMGSGMRGGYCQFTHGHKRIVNWPVTYTHYLCPLALQVTNMWVAVYEEYTAAYLTERHIPCFDARQMLEVDPTRAHCPFSGLFCRRACCRLDFELNRVACTSCRDAKRAWGTVQPHGTPESSAICWVRVGDSPRYSDRRCVESHAQYPDPM